MPTYKVLIAEFPFGNSTHPDVAEWVADTMLKMASDPRIGKDNIFRLRLNDTPVSMTRNAALLVAESQGMDYVIMVDSDMGPDQFIDGSNNPANPGVKPFWDSSFEFMLANPDAGAIGAPYCCGGERERVLVFRWANYHEPALDGSPNFVLQEYDRSTAAGMTGIHEAGSIGTGLCLINMAVAKRMPHPRFKYEWLDHTESAKASTEEIPFFRDMALPPPVGLGAPVYCNWDAWAKHHKSRAIGKPGYVPKQYVRNKLVEAVRHYDSVPQVNKGA